MNKGTVGPAELVLMASVARAHYLEGKAKTEIAEQFAISRFKVARLLDQALEIGLVRIEVGRPGDIDVALSAELQAAFHLKQAIVVSTPETDAQALRDQLGRAAADLLSEIVTVNDVLGFGWARSLLAIKAALRGLAPCPVVQLTGALSRPDVDVSSIELVRDIARIGGGPAYYFYAPMLVPDRTTAAVLRQQPEVARAFHHFSSVTKAVVGIGGWRPPASTVYDALTPAERSALLRHGVAADVSGILLDAAGNPVEVPPTDRMIRISAEDLQRIPEVIALAYGPEKAPAAHAAIAGGFVTGLVTHAGFARALLALDARPGTGDR
jgi:DNA-binding transcriptional regulator LsrR (DeoR family)